MTRSMTRRSGRSKFPSERAAAAEESRAAQEAASLERAALKWALELSLTEATEEKAKVEKSRESMGRFGLQEKVVVEIPGGGEKRKPGKGELGAKPSSPKRSRRAEPNRPSAALAAALAALQEDEARKSKSFPALFRQVEEVNAVVGEHTKEIVVTGLSETDKAPSR